MFSQLKGLLSKASEKTKASVAAVGEKVSDVVAITPKKDETTEIPSDQQPSETTTSTATTNAAASKAKGLLGSVTQTLKEETVKIGAELLAPAHLFVLSPQFYSDNVNIEAGLALLNNIEQDLINLHNASRSIAAKADATDVKIGPVYRAVIAEQESWSRFCAGLNLMTEITSSVERAKADVESIFRRLEFLESSLTEQTEVVRSLEIESFKTLHSNATTMYKQRKIQQIDQIENEMRIVSFKRDQQKMELEKLKYQERLNEQLIKAKEKERADRIREQELALEREREQNRAKEALNDAFKQEMSAYVKGTSKKKTSRRKKKPITKGVSQIDVTDQVSKNNLEEFLGTDSDIEQYFKKPAALSDEEGDAASTQVLQDEDVESAEETGESTEHSEETKDSESAEQEGEEAPEDTVTQVEHVDENWM